MDAYSAGGGSSDEQREAQMAQLRAEPRDSMLLMATLRRANGADVAVKNGPETHPFETVAYLRA